jgi:hypothetical protein
VEYNWPSDPFESAEEFLAWIAWIGFTEVLPVACDRRTYVFGTYRIAQNVQTPPGVQDFWWFEPGEWERNGCRVWKIERPPTLELLAEGRAALDTAQRTAYESEWREELTIANRYLYARGRSVSGYPVLCAAEAAPEAVCG